MTLNRYAIGLLVVVLAAIAWRYRHSDLIQGWANPPSHKPLRIEFDNGTVRKYDTETGAGKKAGPAPLPIGALRKCQAGAAISYTNHPCPPGARELPVSGGSVTVVEGLAPRPAAGPRQLPGAGAQGAGGLGSVAEPTLRDKAIERAIDR